MNKKISSMALAFAALAAAPGAFAADGQIDFTGNIIATTCVVNASAAKDFTVVLPTVASTTLASAGATAGRTGFEIEVSACTVETSVSTYFEPGLATAASGNLSVDAGGATNVELQLLNDAFQPIDLNAPAGMQNSQLVNLVGGEAIMNYYAQYMATGAASAGAANSRVQYTVQYQ